MLHAASVPVLRLDAADAGSWLWADAYRSAACAGIPLFVMLSGALVLPAPRWDAMSFFRRRARKVLLPLLAWSVIYAIWTREFHGDDMTVPIFFQRLASGIDGGAYIHLWFLYLIVSLYLLVPVLRVYVAHAPLPNQLYFAALWVLATAILPTFAAAGLPIGLYLAPVAGFIGYFVLGATVARFVSARLPRGHVIAAAVVLTGMVAATAWGTWLQTAPGGPLYEQLYSHVAPNVIAMGISAFLLLRHAAAALSAKLPASWRRALASVSEASFGIYLIHVLVLELIESGRLGFGLGRADFDAALNVPAVSIVTFGASFAAVVALRHTPLRSIVP